MIALALVGTENFCVALLSVRAVCVSRAPRAGPSRERGPARLAINRCRAATDDQFPYIYAIRVRAVNCGARAARLSPGRRRRAARARRGPVRAGWRLL